MSPNSETLVPSSNFYSQYNNQDIKRPLKTNHSDLSFKRSFFRLQADRKNLQQKEFLEFF